MRFFDLVSTPEREKVAGHVLRHSSQPIRINAMARELHLSPGQVHKCVQRMRDLELVREDRIIEGPRITSLRRMFNVSELEEKKIASLIQEGFKPCLGIGVYGSWASGTNTEDSDLDIWIKLGIQPPDASIAATRRKIQQRLGVSVDFVFATRERMQDIAAKSPSLFYALHQGIVLWGEPL